MRLPSLLLLLALVPTAAAQTAGAASAGGGNFRVVRSVAGSEGNEQQGRFVVSDPRSVFHVPADKRVIVYFDWEGPLGEHRFEGYWRNPEGKVVIISDFKFTARQRRFGGYWQLDLTPSTAAGVWTLEARIDGETAGSHSFQIVQSERPAPVSAVPHLLPPAEAYQRLLASTVVLHRVDAAGRLFGSGLGFVLERGLIATAFQSIDGATTLRVRFPDGRRITDPVVAWWDQLRDVALLRADTGDTPALPLARPGSWAVGDNVFALDVGAEGATVIKQEGIFGLNESPGRGPRINITDLHTPAAAGGPLLSDRGQVIGIIGGSLFPGMPSAFAPHVFTVYQSTQGSLATPISVLPVEGAPAGGKTLAEMRALGHFIPPLTRTDDLISGSLGEEVKKVKNNPAFTMPRMPKSEFSRSQGKIGVVLTWSSRSKLKGSLVLRIYDLSNRPVYESLPLALKLQPGQFAGSTWNLDISRLPVGAYRTDVLLDQAPIWRAYLQLRD